MPPQDEAIPTTQEVEQQLERMIASEAFSSRPQQAKLFAFLVRGALAGLEITEKDIRAKFFPSPPYDPESTIARTTVNHVRSLADEYYEHAGRGDPVVIQLPSKKAGTKAQPGTAYRPVVRYNPRHAIAQKYKLGLYYLRPKTPFEIADAIEQFSQVLDLQPDHVGAHAGMAETMCLLTCMVEDSRDPLAVAHHFAGRAVELAPEDWRAHAAWGATLLLSCELRSAATAFDDALKLNRSQTLKYGWYHAFLLAAGRSAEAVELARSRAEERLDDAYAKALYGVHLYLTRQFEDADAVLEEALLLDHNCWIAYLAQALVRFARNDAREALARLRHMHLTLHISPDDQLFPGLTALFAASARNLPDDFRLSAIETARQAIGKERKGPWIQLALLAMSAGQADRALEALECAWSQFHPLMLFAHLLPLFDSLRENVQFDNLLRRRLEIAVPSSSDSASA